MTSNELEIFKQSILDDVRVMMQTTGQVTQYIGARYVPLFAEPLEWNSQMEYEPLTIVLNQGNSYTSRQFVPKGIDIKNTAFWASTGNYNAQIEQYRQEVNSFDGRITANTNNITNNANKINIINKEINKFEDDIIIIGDSWSEPYSVRESKTWVYNLDKYIKSNIHNYARGGASVIGNTPDPNLNGNFKGQINSAIADDSFNHDNVGTIILFGGVNDYRSKQPYNDVIESFKLHINELHSEFAKSRIIVVLNHQALVDDNQFTWFNTIAFSLSRYCSVYTTFNWFAFPSLWNTDDYVHPSQGNEGGAMCVLQNMLAIIKNGAPTTTYSYDDLVLTDLHGNKFSIKLLINVDNLNGVCNSTVKFNVIKDVNIQKGANFIVTINRDGTTNDANWTVTGQLYNPIILEKGLGAFDLVAVDNVTNNSKLYLSMGTGDRDEHNQMSSFSLAFHFDKSGVITSHRYVGNGATVYRYGN